MKYTGIATFIVVITIACFLPSCRSLSKKIHESSKTKISYDKNKQKLPKDLMYKGKPISNACMGVLVPILCGAADSIEVDLDTFAQQKNQDVVNADEFCTEKDAYEWKYIGTLPHGDHLIYGYLWPAGAMGKFTEIAIVKRIGNTLKTVGYIAGGDRHATMINGDSCRLEGDTLTYYQHMTNGLLYSVIMGQYPELKELTENKSHEKLYWGEADYLGYGTFEVTITPEGTLKEHRLISFTPAEGRGFCSDDEAKQYYDDWLKNTPKASLVMGDAIHQLLNFYFYKNSTNVLNAHQLKEMMMEVFAYAAAE